MELLEVRMSTVPKTPTPAPTVEETVKDTITGNAYFKAWSRVVDALNDADPTWAADRNKSPVDNAVEWIERHAKK